MPKAGNRVCDYLLTYSISSVLLGSLYFFYLISYFYLCGPCGLIQTDGQMGRCVTALLVGHRTSDSQVAGSSPG